MTGLFALICVGCIAAIAIVAWVQGVFAAREAFTDENNPYIAPSLYRGRKIPDIWRQYKKDHTLNGAVLDFLPGTRFNKLPVDHSVQVRRRRAGYGGHDNSRIHLRTNKGGVIVTDAQEREVHRLEPGTATHGGHVVARRDVRLGDCLIRDEGDHHRWNAQKLHITHPDTKYTFTLDVTDRTPSICMGETCVNGDQLQKLWKITHDGSYTWDALEADSIASGETRVKGKTTSQNNTIVAEMNVANKSNVGVDDARGDLELRGSNCGSNAVRLRKTMNTNFNLKNGRLCIDDKCVNKAVPTNIQGLYANYPFVTVPYKKCTGGGWFSSCSWKTFIAIVRPHLSKHRHDYGRNRTDYVIKPA